jgi:hypothetical protein
MAAGARNEAARPAIRIGREAPGGAQQAAASRADAGMA